MAMGQSHLPVLYLWTFLLFLYFIVEIGKKLRRPESTSYLEQSQEDGTIERKGKK